MFPSRPDDLGLVPPIPATATLPSQPAPVVNMMAAEVEARAAEFLADLKPTGAVAQYLTRRAAMLSVRLERLERYHAATTAYRVRRAENEFVQDRLAEVDHLFSWIGVEPAVYSRRLRQSPEGIDRMLQAWAGLRIELLDPEFPRWNGDHCATALHLLGLRPSDLPVSPIQIYTNAYNGTPSPLVEASAELKGLTRSQRQVVAGERLLAIIDAETARLHQERAALDLTGLDRDRAEAVDRALVDRTPQGNQIQRYEMASERALNRAFEMIKDLNRGRKTDPELNLDPSELIANVPDPTQPKREFHGPIGRRSRQHLASQKAARQALDDQVESRRPKPER